MTAISIMRVAFEFLRGFILTSSQTFEEPQNPDIRDLSNANQYMKKRVFKL
jgi:hypothetical protein